MKRITKESNKRLKILYEFLSLQEILDKEFKKYQKSFIVTSNENESTLGMYIKIKQDRMIDLVSGLFFIDTKSNIEIVFDSKTILVYQLDKYDELALVAIFIFRQYTTELVCQFLLQLKDLSGDINEISVDLDEIFIEGIIMYKNQNKTTLYIWDEFLVKDTKDVVSISSYINTAFAVAQSENLKNKENAEKRKLAEKKEIEEIINSISTKIDKLWSKYEKFIKFSKSIPKAIIAKYFKWKEENASNLNKEIIELFKFFIPSIPINSKFINEWIKSIIGFNLKGVIQAFSKNTEESLINNITINNSLKDDKIKELLSEEKCSSEEELVSVIWKCYAPQVTQKIIMNYLLWKMWIIEIPTSLNPNSANLPSIIVKEPMTEESKIEGNDGKPSIDNFKSYSINPQSLAWSCGESSPDSLSWIHRLAYLINWLKIDIKMLIENHLIIPENFKIKKISKLKSFYSKILSNWEEMQKWSENGNLFKLSKIAKDFVEAEAIRQKKQLEESKMQIATRLSFENKSKEESKYQKALNYIKIEEDQQNETIEENNNTILTEVKWDSPEKQSGEDIFDQTHLKKIQQKKRRKISDEEDEYVPEWTSASSVGLPWTTNFTRYHIRRRDYKKFTKSYEE